MFKYYYYYVRAIIAKYQAYFEIKANERRLNECWRKILENKDNFSEEKLADVTARALKAERDLETSWQLYHEIYNF